MVKLLIVKYQKFQTLHENTRFLYLNPLEYYFTKKQIWWFLLYQYLFKYNIFLNITYLNTCVCVQARYWYPFYMVFNQYRYVDKRISKVPISSEIGVLVQGSTSKIWNSSSTPFLGKLLLLSPTKIKHSSLCPFGKSITV